MGAIVDGAEMNEITAPSFPDGIEILAMPDSGFIKEELCVLCVPIAAGLERSAVIEGELDKFEAQLPDKAKGYYTTQVSKKGPDALAAVKDRVCQGCRTTLTEQMLIELRNGAFLPCVACGRMLYPVAAAAAPAEE